MNDINSILVPVDLGPATESILTAAGRLAESMDSSITVLHVLQPVPSIPMAAGQMASEVNDGFNIPVYQKTIEDRAMEAMEEMVGRTIPENRVSSMQVKTGSVGSTILDECSRGDYDLVVVNSGEDRDLATRLFGSVADKVVKNAPTSVLVLRAGRKEEKKE